MIERIPTDFDSDDEARSAVGARLGSGNPLPMGHELQEFVLEGLVGEGGFGIVYLARDTHLGRKVALKEYMPSALAVRRADHGVTVRSQQHRDTFELGLRSFINEAQLLASFDHPSLVKVYRFWQQNGTAYMVMPYYEGPTLKNWLADHRGAPDEAWLRALLAPLTDALELLHNDHCYHRDVAPDNILLLDGRDGGLRPLLLDFGAARRVIGDATQALTAILKPGYAPVEQYAETASSKQGPWTDVYALCAVLYNAVTGRIPVPSVSRLMIDELVPASEAARRTVIHRASWRRSMPAWPFAPNSGRSRWLRCVCCSMQRCATKTSSPPSCCRRRVSPIRRRRRPMRGRGPSCRCNRATRAGARRASSAPRPSRAGAAPSAPRLRCRSVPARSSSWASRSPGGLFSRMPRRHRRSRSLPRRRRPSPNPQPPSPAPRRTAPAAPFTVLAALQDIVRLGDPQIAVDATADKASIVIGRDRLQFRVRSSDSGYLYLFFGATDKSHFYLLFPNQIDRDNRIDAGREMVLPKPGWHITAGGPPGTDHIVAMVSKHRRDLAGTGLRQAGRDIPEFDLALARQRWSQRTEAVSPFVGKPICQAGTACEDAYGATLLQVEEVAAGTR